MVPSGNLPKLLSTHNPPRPPGSLSCKASWESSCPAAAALRHLREKMHIKSSTDLQIFTQQSVFSAVKPSLTELHSIPCNTLTSLWEHICRQMEEITQEKHPHRSAMNSTYILYVQRGHFLICIHEVTEEGGAIYITVSWEVWLGFLLPNNWWWQGIQVSAISLQLMLDILQFQ